MASIFTLQHTTQLRMYSLGAKVCSFNLCLNLEYVVLFKVFLWILWLYSAGKKFHRAASTLTNYFFKKLSSPKPH